MTEIKLGNLLIIMIHLQNSSLNNKASICNNSQRAEAENNAVLLLQPRWRQTPPHLPGVGFTLLLRFFGDHQHQPSAALQLYSCIPAHLYTCTLAQLHTFTPAHQHTCIPAHLHFSTSAHLYTCRPADLHTCTSVQVHTCTPAHRYTCTPAHLHACTSVHIHACTSAHLYSCTSAHLYLCTPDSDGHLHWCCCCSTVEQNWTSWKLQHYILLSLCCKYAATMETCSALPVFETI